MDIKIIFAILASIIYIIGPIPYVRDIFLHKTKPHSYSWLIWCVLQTTIAVVMLRGGAGEGSVPVILSSIICGFIFILSLWHGTSNIKSFDLICLIGALFAIGIYLFLHNGLLSVILVVAIDFIALLPTLRKTYQEPNTETMSLYLLGFLGHIFSLFAIANFTIITSLYLISVAITNFACVGVILLARKRDKDISKIN